MSTVRRRNTFLHDFVIALVLAIAAVGTFALATSKQALAQLADINCADVNGGAIDRTVEFNSPVIVLVGLQAGEKLTFSTAFSSGLLTAPGQVRLTAAPAGVVTPQTIIASAVPPQSGMFTATVAGDYSFQYLTGGQTSDFIRYTARCSIRTGDTSQSFLANRIDRMVSEEPDRNRYIRRLTGSTWGLGGQQTPLAFNATGNSANGKTDFKFATSLEAIANAEANRAQQQIASLGYAKGGYNPGAEQIRQGLDIWVEGHYTSYDIDNKNVDRDGDVGIVYMGADALITTNTLLGFLIQYDWAEEDSNQNTDVDGDGWMVGPYMSTRLGQNLFFDLRAAWGESDNDTNSNGVTGSFDTERWLVRGNLTGNWQRGDWRFTPSVGVTYAEEEADAFTDSNGTFIAANTVELGRVTFGPEISNRIQLSNGTIVEPHLSLTGIWDFERPDSGLTFGGAVAGTEDFRAQAKLGIIVKKPNGISFRSTFAYDGIFDDDFDAWSARGWISFPIGR